MSEAGRVGDQSYVPHDAHSCKKCPHAASGPATSGSSNVFFNDRPALRVGDAGQHSACCGAHGWKATAGAPGVYINGRKVHRRNDATEHCGGEGRLMEGSSNILIGDYYKPFCLACREKTPTRLESLMAGGMTAQPLGCDGLSSLLGKSLAEGLPALLTKGLPGLVYGLLGKTMGLLATVITDILCVAGWIAMHVVKIGRISAAEFAEQYFTNVLDNLFDGGPRHGNQDCPLPDDDQAPRRLSFAPANRLEPAQIPDFDKGYGSYDVTLIVGDKFLKRFQPIEYQYEDDIRPISIEKLLMHSELVEIKDESIRKKCSSLGEYVGYLEPETVQPKEKKDALFYLDIDEDYIIKNDDLTTTELEGIVYGRAVYCRDQKDLLFLEYIHIRTASWLPTKCIDKPPMHEGDGEAATIVVQRDPNHPEAYRLLGTITGGHDNPPAYCLCRKIIVEGGGHDERPVIFVAHGSHALSPQPGKRDANTGMTDWFPPQQDGSGVKRLLPELKTSRDQNIKKAVFTHKVIWGAEKSRSHGGHDWLPGDANKNHVAKQLENPCSEQKPS